MPQLASTTAFLLSIFGVEAVVIAEYGNCTTKGCVQSASIIIQLANISADPCDDFYQFACGRFLADSDPVNSYEQLGNADFETLVNKAIKEMLATSIDDAKPALQKAIRYYNSCPITGDLFSNDESSAAFLKQLLSGDFLGFHLSQEDKLNQNWTIENALAASLTENGTALFRLSVEPDSRNPERFGLFLEPESTPLFVDQEVLESLTKGDATFLNEVKAAYLQYLKGLLKQILPTDELSFVRDSFLKELIDFELELAKITPAARDASLKETSQNAYSVSVNKLTALCSQINWTNFFTVLGRDNHVTALQKPGDLKVSYRTGSYFRDLAKMLNETFHKLGDARAKRTIRNYFSLKVILVYIADHISCGFLVPFAKLRHMVQNSIPKVTLSSCMTKGRPFDCLSNTRQQFPQLLARKFIQRHFDANSTFGELATLVESIHAEIGDLLKHVDWMDNATRHSALFKFQNMLFTFGFPENLFDESFDQQYNGLAVGDNFAENVKNLRRFSAIRSLQKLDHGLGRSDKFWLNVDPASPNVFYHQLSNTIGVTAGHAMSPNFRLDFPPAYNWGRVATATAHQMFLALGISGKDLNGFGKHVDNWWSNKTQQDYQALAECLADGKAYDTDNLEEHVAELSGMKLAYMALNRILGNGFLERVELPGLPYTNEQIFFLANAQRYCYSYDDVGQSQLMEKLHDLPQTKINDLMMNFERWADAFNCRLGSAMNPRNRQRCEVW